MPLYLERPRACAPIHLCQETEGGFPLNPKMQNSSRHYRDTDNCNEPISKVFVPERNCFFQDCTVPLDTFLGEPHVGAVPVSRTLPLLSEPSSVVSVPWTSPSIPAAMSAVTAMGKEVFAYRDRSRALG